MRPVGRFTKFLYLVDSYLERRAVTERWCRAGAVV